MLMSSIWPGCCLPVLKDHCCACLPPCMTSLYCNSQLTELQSRPVIYFSFLLFGLPNSSATSLCAAPERLPRMLMSSIGLDAVRRCAVKGLSASFATTTDPSASCFPSSLHHVQPLKASLPQCSALKVTLSGLLQSNNDGD